MKKLLMIAAAAIFAVTMAQKPASATPIGTDSPISITAGGAPAVYFDNFSAPDANKSFVDTFTFTAPSDLGSIVIDFFKSGIGATFAILANGLGALDPTQSLGTPSLLTLGGVTFNSTEWTFSNFVANAVYSIQVSGLTKSGGGYLFKLAANTAVTPIPPALLMFVTALGGLGFVGFRKRSLAA